MAVDARDIWQALRTVMDPEIPVLSVVDLGIVEAVRVGEEVVEVDLIPTFVACPATRLIVEAVRAEVARHVPDRRVAVRLLTAPPWTTARVTEEGRRQLVSFGIAFEDGGLPPCPFCGSARTVLASDFGPTLCRRVYYCEDCRQPFEAMKQVGLREDAP